MDIKGRNLPSEHSTLLRVGLLALTRISAIVAPLFAFSSILFFYLSCFISLIKTHTCRPLRNFCPVPSIIPLICYLLSLLSCACPLLFIEYSQNYQQALRQFKFAHNKSKNLVINVTVKLYLLNLLYCYSSNVSSVVCLVSHWS